MANITKDAFKGGLWLGLLKALSQVFSWFITVMVARILVPEDYGLMEIATILTGYIMIFSDLGLGAAIIQKEKVTEDELSSTFWFMIFIGIFLGMIAFGLAYPTARIFNESRLIPITRVASALFVIGATLIVPYKLLDRNLKFKRIGFIDLMAVVISSSAMLSMAKAGFGVWTLIGGHILRQIARVFVTFALTKWRPKLHYEFSEVKSFLRFGINVAGSRSLFYVYKKSDRFFAGKILGTQPVGFYSFALQLSSIPTDKIVSLIQRVSFPVFSKFQNDPGEFENFYLKITRFIAIIVLPIFVGGAFLAGEIIPVILGEKWLPAIYPFRLLCLAQIIVSITVVNNLANNAQGRPHWGLYFNLANSIFLPFSFYIACLNGFKVLPLPWLTVYPVISLIWTLVTLRKIDISVLKYFRNLLTPFIATAVMLIGVLGSRYIFKPLSVNSTMSLLLEILVGTIFYLGYLLLFERNTLISIRNLRKG